MNESLNQFFTGWTFRRVMLGTLVILGVVGLAYILLTFANIFVVIFIAFLISTAVRPLVQRLQRFRIPPAIGVILVYAGLMIGVITLGVVVVPLVVNQISAISIKIPEYYDTLRSALVSSSSTIVRNISIRLPTEPPVFLSGLNSATAEAPNDPTAAVTQLWTVLTDAGKVIFVVFATLLLAFFWTLDGERIIRTLLQLVRPEDRDNTRQIVQEIQHKLGAYIRGQIILDLFVGSMATIAYLFIGLEYAIVLGILAGILETVPILGPILGAIPAAAIALATGDTSVLVAVIVATVLIQQVEGAILVPRVMDRAVGINAVVTLLAFAAFSSLLGLLGGLLAVPLAAVLQIIIIHFLFKPNNVQEAINQRDRFGVLRYDTQELAQTLRLNARDDNEDHNETRDILEDNLEAIVVDLDKLLVQASQESRP